MSLLDQLILLHPTADDAHNDDGDHDVAGDGVSLGGCEWGGSGGGEQ